MFSALLGHVRAKHPEGDEGKGKEEGKEREGVRKGKGDEVGRKMVDER